MRSPVDPPGSSDAALSAIFLVGGRCALDTLTLWGRTNAANLLLPIWLREAANVDLPFVQRFAHQELKEGYFWTTVKLLEIALLRQDIRSGPKFELLATLSMALAKLEELFLIADTRNNRIAKCQTQWVLSEMDRPSVVKRKKLCASKALQIYAQIQEPSEGQTLMKNHLQSIAGDEH